MENFKGISSGTATKFLTINILHNLKIVIADKLAHQKFDLISNIIFTRIQTLERERELLYDLRDTVLVKIIKGN